MIRVKFICPSGYKCSIPYLSCKPEIGERVVVDYYNNVLEQSTTRNLEIKSISHGYHCSNAEEAARIGYSTDYPILIIKLDY